MQKLIDTVDYITERIGSMAAWLAVVLVVVTGVIVLFRYAFQSGSIALQESLIYINALLFTLGAGYTLRHDGHVRVDIFYNRLTGRGKAWVNLGGSLFLLLPVCIFILWSSWDYVARSWSIRESSAETSGLPIVYLLKTTLLVLPALLLWQGFAECCKSIRQLRGSSE